MSRHEDGLLRHGGGSILNTVSDEEKKIDCTPRTKEIDSYCLQWTIDQIGTSSLTTREFHHRRSYCDQNDAIDTTVDSIVTKGWRIIPGEPSPKSQRQYLSEEIGSEKSDRSRQGQREKWVL